ncbi:flagellar basal body-associated FliL family protein [Thermodesulfovibrio hydrogeniphilus]
MAKEKNEEQEQAPAPEKKKKGKLLIIIIAVVVLLAGGAGAYFFLLNKGGEKDKAHATKESKEAQGVNFALEPFVVNLMDQKYLKVSIQIELSNPKLMETAKAKTPQIRDAIITILSSKSSEELITPEGKLIVKDEIKMRANQVLGENSVLNVYLTDFVMQ